MAIHPDATYDLHATLGATLTASARPRRAENPFGATPRLAVVAAGLVLETGETAATPTRWWDAFVPAPFRPKAERLDVAMPGLASHVRSGDVVRVVYDLGGRLGVFVTRDGALLLAVGSVASELGLDEPEAPEDVDYATMRATGERLPVGETRRLGGCDVTLLCVGPSSIPARQVVAAASAPAVPHALAQSWARLVGGLEESPARPTAHHG